MGDDHECGDGHNPPLLGHPAHEPVPTAWKAEQAAIAYRSNTGSSTINSPKTRTWDGSTWSAEAEQASANNPIRVVRMAWSPTDVNTHIVVTESDDGFLDAYVCTPTCVVTNNIGQVWSTAPASGTPQARFDIA